MAIRWLESFGHYAGANIAEKWPIVSAPLTGIGNYFQMSSSGSTWSDAYLQYRGQKPGLYDSNGSVRRDFVGSTDSAWIVGFQFMPTRVQTGISNDTFGGPLLRLLNNGSEQWGIRCSSAPQIYLSKAGTTQATASLTMGTSTWYMIEFKIVLSTTVGSYELRINGTTYLSASGINTRGVTSDVFDGLMIGNAGNGGGATVGNSSDFNMSDLYVLTTSGNAPTNFIGDARVHTLLPNGTGSPGDAQSWSRTGSGLTANYQAVDDATANQDTDYVHSLTVNARDLYTYASLPAGASQVYGIQAITEAKKDDSGTRTLGITVRSGGSEADFPTTQALTGSYQMLPFIDENNPVTSAAWAVADVNAIQAGPKVVA